MKRISVGIDKITKDDNGEWIVDNGEIAMSCEDGTEAGTESIITIGASSVRIEDIVEFLQMLGIISEDCWR